MNTQVATAQICQSNQAQKGRYILGISFILLQCFVWTGASVLTQYMFSDEQEQVSSPFLMTYTGVALMTILLPIRWLKERFWESPDGACHGAIEEADSFDQAIADANAYSDIISVMGKRSLEHATSTKKWNHKKHVLAALNIAPSMFLADYAYNRGLRHTTVASSTVLVSTSSVFVLFISTLLRMEHFNMIKFVAVVLAITGTAMTTLQDAQTDEEEALPDEILNDETMLYGDMWSLIAAVGYAAYSIQARVLCPENEDLYSMPLLLGYVGLLSAVPLLPMAAYKMFQEVNSFQQFGILCVKGLLDFVVADFLLFRAVMLTSATVANVGLGLTIPLAFLADYLVHSATFSPLQLIGAAMIMIGFVVVNLTSDENEQHHQQQEEDEHSETNGASRSSPLKNDSVNYPIV